MEKSNVNVFSRFICNIYTKRQDVLYKENSYEKGSPQLGSRTEWAGRVSSCVILYMVWVNLTSTQDVHKTKIQYSTSQLIFFFF